MNLFRSVSKNKLIDKNVYRLEDISDSDIKFSGSNDAIRGEGINLRFRQWMQINGIHKVCQFRNGDGDNYDEKDRKPLNFYMDYAYFEKMRANWKFPYHFIDFETSTPALPFFAHMSPFAPIAFQFSHHIMYEDGRVEHVGEFLNTSTARDRLYEGGKTWLGPNIDFIRELKKQLERDDGTVFRWTAHEHTILKAILREFQCLRAALPSDVDVDVEELKILEQFIVTMVGDVDNDIAPTRSSHDLWQLASGAYFHPLSDGSSSIKALLRPVMSSSSFLEKKYSSPDYVGMNFKDMAWWRQKEGEGDCDGALTTSTKIRCQDPYRLLAQDYPSCSMIVKDGGSATAAYSTCQWGHLSEAEKAAIEKALLRYCELDTLAMVIVLEGFIDFASGSGGGGGSGGEK